MTNKKACYNIGMTKGTIKTSSSTPVSTTKTGGEGEKKQKIVTGGKAYKPKGIGIGGAREKSGREEKNIRLEITGVSKMIDQHLVEEVVVTEINVNTKQRTETKKPAVRAILDMLRYQALKHSDVRAAKEYLDRTLGRAKQHIDLTSEIVTEAEQALPTKAEEAAAAAYIANMEDDE